MSAVQFQQALLEEMATVLGSLVGHPGTTLACSTDIPLAWRIQVSVGGTWNGEVTLGFATDDMARLAQYVMGLEAPADDVAVADLLLEATNQALAGLVTRPAFTGLMARASTPTRESGGCDLGEAGLVCVTYGDTQATIACRALVAPSGPRASAEAERGAAEPAVTRGRPIASDAPTNLRGGSQAYPANLDVILDIDLPLTVRFGEAEMTLDALTRLGPGSVIDMVRSPDEPVDVLVNGRLVARGEVVVVSGNYGVRVSEVVSAADRLRSMGA